jgi:hypothetical protein
VFGGGDDEEEEKPQPKSGATRRQQGNAVSHLAGSILGGQLVASCELT